MENKDIPYIVFEGELARHERYSKRLIIVLVIAIIALAVTNLAWIYAWNSYEYISDTTSYYQDGEGVNIIGDENSINESEENNND